MRSCLIDGEAIAFEADGLASFQLLRGRRHDKLVTLCAFDLSSTVGICGVSRLSGARPCSPGLRAAPAGVGAQRHLRGARRRRVQARMRARLRGHRQQAARVALPFRPACATVEVQESGGTGGAAGGGGGVG